MNNAPAGWYPPDLTEPEELRYWDGSGWTDDVRTQVVSAPRVRRGHGAKVALIISSVAIAVLGFGAIATAVGTGAPTHSANPNSITAHTAVKPASTAQAVADAPPTAAAATTPATTQAAISASPSPSPTATFVAKVPSASAEKGTALNAALALTVKGRAAKTGYSRAQFGNAWVDVNRNGCDTRNDELRLRLTHKKMSGACKVLAGDLKDPYTNTAIHFERGGASEVDIDHLVALSDAWQKGAAKWPFAERVAFANDPLNLEPVDASANRQKGDGDAATWLPSNKAWRCDYVARQVAVKTKYQVWVTPAEQDAMVRVLGTCPDHALPAFGTQPVIASNTGGPAPTATTTKAPTSTKTVTGSSGKLDPDYGTCKNAIAHGAGPYYKGKDAEYAWYRDGDSDGIVCER